MLGNTVRKGLSALVSTMPHTTVYAAEHALPVAVARMQADFEFSTCRYRLLLVYGFIQTRSRYKPQALHLGADPQRLTFLRPRWGLGSQPPTCPRVAGALHGMSWPWRCRCSRALPAASSLRAVADGEKAAGDESCRWSKQHGQTGSTSAARTCSHVHCWCHAAPATLLRLRPFMSSSESEGPSPVVWGTARGVGTGVGAMTGGGAGWAAAAAGTTADATGVGGGAASCGAA